MAWLVGIAVVLLLIYSSGFRKAALGIVVVGAIGIGIIVLYTQESKREARERIPVGDLELSDISLEQQYGSYTIVGRIKNNSHQYTLTGLGLNVVFEDCESELPRTSCVIIGEDKDHYFSMNVPPGQVRDMSEYVYPGSTRPKGKLVWHYSISYIEAK